MSNTTCTRCGSFRVRWATGKSGSRYLENTSHEYDNGARYGRGPHFKTCERTAADRDSFLAEQAIARKAALRAGLFSRYLNVWGPDIRDWFAVDPGAANAHLDTVMTRSR